MGGIIVEHTGTVFIKGVEADHLPHTQLPGSEFGKGPAGHGRIWPITCSGFHRAARPQHRGRDRQAFSSAGVVVPPVELSAAADLPQNNIAAIFDEIPASAARRLD